MKRFVIRPKACGGFNRFVLPTIETLDFSFPIKFGGYCANDGSLWSSLDDGKWIFKTEIKAVTYHQIQVNRTPTGWEAKIIFDV